MVYIVLTETACECLEDEAYKQAYEKAEKELTTTHPIRLGLALNYSVYCYEANEPNKACELAKKVNWCSIINGDFNLVLLKAFDDAVADLKRILTRIAH